MSGPRMSDDLPVLLCPAEGDPIRSVRDALDLVGEAGYLGARWVAVPAERFDAGFFELRTGLAGEIVQKFAQYGVGLAVLGDVSAHTERSAALADFVRECDRGHQVWFPADLAELRARLTG